MVRLFRDPALAERLGQAGALRWARQFTEEGFGERLRALLSPPPRFVNDARKSSFPAYHPHR
jgi:hypothetical protein